MVINETVKKVLFICVGLFVLSDWCSAPYALLLGILFALLLTNPFPDQTRKLAPMLLKASIIGIGFGINLNQAVEIGSTGLLFTVASVSISILLGYVAGKIFNIEAKISYLISVGSAICGGTAIAAVSPIANADQRQISTAMGTVFVLNAVALFLFPFVGELLELSQTQFGYWSGIAIHDTSSVVGAASIYGKEALITATTVKLGRTLWIIPAIIISSFVYKNKEGKKKIPYFILFFLLAIVLSSYIPEINNYSQQLRYIAKKGFSLTLFLIGAGISRTLVKSVGWRPFAQGIFIWVIISVGALVAIMNFVQ